jgi:hypothetical protein
MKEKHVKISSLKESGEYMILYCPKLGHAQEKTFMKNLEEFEIHLKFS